MNEVWKELTGFDYKVEVSNKGRVKKYRNNNCILKSFPNNPKKYSYVFLQSNTKGKSYPVHRLVLTAFIGEPPEKYVCNHKDGNKSNNIPENLEWVTSSENAIHAIKTGLNKGGIKYSRKPSLTTNALMRNLVKFREKQGLTRAELADKVGITRQSICNYEIGLQDPNVMVGRIIASALNITIDELVED
jgi:DNA-binding XRE family transcriptional regulator